MSDLTEPPMSPYYRAKLKLAAWQALEGWGARNDLPPPTVQPWGWETRMRKADELLAWMLDEQAETSDA